jgi:hypothetical protein
MTGLIGYDKAILNDSQTRVSSLTSRRLRAGTDRGAARTATRCIRCSG